MKFRLSLAFALLLSTNLATADKMNRYEVSITNITRGQTFTPQLVAIHEGSVSFFTLGEPASTSLELLAEAGDTGPLSDKLTMLNEVGDVITVPDLLKPGKTIRFEISGHHRYHHLSFAAMLISTNDTFVALSGMKLPHRGAVSYFASAYDAGTEKNDQNCAHIPGPPCGGEAHSEQSDMDEGYVYLSNGFHDLGEMDDAMNKILGPMIYDWRNPVAQVTIKKIDKD